MSEAMTDEDLAEIEKRLKESVRYDDMSHVDVELAVYDCWDLFDEVKRLRNALGNVEMLCSSTDEQVGEIRAVVGAADQELTVLAVRRVVAERNRATSDRQRAVLTLSKLLAHVLSFGVRVPPDLMVEVSAALTGDEAPEGGP